MKDDVSLTPQEVADILKIAKNTVYEMIKRGELPAYRIGRKLRIDLHDVEAYKRQGKRMEMPQLSDSALAETPRAPATAPFTTGQASDAQSLVICGNDVLLDILTFHLERHPSRIIAFRHHVGSFAGLLAIYQGKAHMASAHLWDGETGIYNIPYVRYLLPGIPAIIVHLACRLQGFYVAEGNPKEIKTWQDLTRPDICFANREKGSGTRILLDEQIRRLGLDKQSITGYEREELSHLAVASTIVRGEADVALGNERASLQIRGVDFVPLQKERYDLVIRKEDIERPQFQAVLEVLQSVDFQMELLGLGGYDLAETGEIVAEV